MRLFQFSEANGMSGTCIGYSSSTSGRAFGPIKSKQSLLWAQEVIRFGVKDPELFSAIGLFEKGIGSDLISDMVLSIIFKHIVKFNNKVFKKIRTELGIEIALKDFQLSGLNVRLPVNPFSTQEHPIILLPSDILKHIPALDDPRSIDETIIVNKEVRDRINRHLSSLFAAKNKKDRKKILEQAKENAEAFQALLDALKMLEKSPYDFKNDPKGLQNWAQIGKKFAKAFPLEIKVNKSLSRLEQIDSICLKIIEKFEHNIVFSRLSRDLYDKDMNPKNESFSQRLFMVIADAYCDGNNIDIDISPESDRGAGPVDFKLSVGRDKVTVEIKLSTNSKVVHGYKKQLEAYENAESSQLSHYVVIDVGKLGNKWKALNKHVQENPKVAKFRRIHYIDGAVRNSASKLPD